MKRESSDKTRFCVSHDGLSNVLETFCLPCFMLKNKTKNMFFEPKGLQYIGAHQIFVLQNRLVGLKYSFAITQMMFNKTKTNSDGLIQLSKIFDGLQYIGARAPL